MQASYLEHLLYSLDKAPSVRCHNCFHGNDIPENYKILFHRKKKHCNLLYDQIMRYVYLYNKIVIILNITDNADGIDCTIIKRVPVICKADICKADICKAKHARLFRFTGGIIN